MYAPGTTVVDRLEVTAGPGLAAQAAALRLRLSHLLGTADLTPPGFPPSAVLIVRRLPDPLPGRLDADGTAMKVDPEWDRAVQAALAQCWRGAACPAAGPVPAGAEAVYFDDAAQLLACLALAVARGEAGGQWWWQGVLRTLRGATAAEVLAAEPRLLPVVIDHLVQQGVAAEILQSVTPAEAEELSRLMALEFGVPDWAAGDVPTDAGPTDAQDAERPRSPHLQLRREPPAPWEAVVLPEAVPYWLGAPTRLLVGLGLVLARRPAAARTDRFARGLRAWWQAACLSGEVGSRAEAGSVPGHIHPAPAEAEAARPEPGRMPGDAVRGQTALQREPDGPARQGAALERPGDSSRPYPNDSVTTPAEDRNVTGTTPGERGEDTGPIPVRHRDDTGTIPRRYQDDTGTTPVRYRDDTGMTPGRHRYDTGTTPVRHRDDTGTIPGRYRDDTGKTPGRYRDDTRTSPGRHRGAAGTARGRRGDAAGTTPERPANDTDGDRTLPYERAHPAETDRFSAGPADLAGPPERVPGADPALLTTREALPQIGEAPAQTPAAETPAGLRPDRAAGADSRLCGLFYLINLMVALDLPAACEADWSLDSGAGPWAVLEALGRGLLGEEWQAYAGDPVWAALAELDGRPDGSLAGDWLPGCDRFLLPPVWISERGLGGPWRWNAAGGRLRIWSEQGFPLADLPEEGDPEEAAAVILLRCGEGADCSAAEMAPVWAGYPGLRRVSAGLERWASFTLPAVRSLLQGALGTAESLVSALLAVPGRIYATRSHLDIVIPIDQISLPVRRAGLDRDPGWLRTWGRVISFHFK